MPSDSNGVFSLVSGYLAADGETIQASQHNPPLEDIASGITGRLPRNGNAAMAGALKLADGTVGAPALAFASATSFGFYKTANGIGVSVNGVQVFEFTSLPKATPVGAMLDWPAFVPPTGWLLCEGQGLSTTTYAALWAVIGNQFGTFGAGTFALPDCRGRVSAGYDITVATLAGSGVLGATLGAQTVTIAQGNLPSYTLPKTLAISDTQAWTVSGQGAGTVIDGGGTKFGGGASGSSATLGVSRTGSVSLTGDTQSGGSGTALANVQPTLILNKIIYTGVV